MLLSRHQDRRWMRRCLMVLVVSMTGCKSQGYQPPDVSDIRLERPEIPPGYFPHDWENPVAWEDWPGRWAAFDAHCRAWATEPARCDVSRMSFPTDDELRTLTGAPAVSDVRFSVFVASPLDEQGNKWQPEAPPGPGMKVVVSVEVSWPTGPSRIKICRALLDPWTTEVRFKQKEPNCGTSIAGRR